MLDLQALGADGDVEHEWLVLDFADAFWHVPLLPSERRFFVACFRGKYLVFMRVAQGSRGAPLV
eukprot:7416182-Heterocapsa_arctica.AAC.1